MELSIIPQIEEIYYPILALIGIPGKFEAVIRWLRDFTKEKENGNKELTI